jgi:bifunctional UDP-N-acetylglucosamine pyrophosphorylase/glucosamine-1-phosphate N-acetyltransferase
VLTGETDHPGNLGRVVRDAEGRVARIVEARDAAGRPDVLALREFNTGIYAFDAASLRPALVDLPTDNAQGEEYATEAVNRLARSGRRVDAVPAEDAGSLLGVNTLEDLAGAVRTLRRRILSRHMEAGVVIVDPDSTVVEPDVEIGAGARILPFTYVQRGCRIASGAQVGPFARLRGGAVLEEGAEVGNFVEVKASTLEAGAKAKHLTYLGDAHVGAGANVGCGTITANYDGHRKHRTRIGARARIGSGTVLIAPVTVGDGALTGAGAVVRAGDDVPPGHRAVGVPAKVLPPKEVPGGGTGDADA